MEKLLVETACKKKEQELLEKYFGNLEKEAALERPETIGEYTKDLPLKIEAEFRAYLEELWKKYAPATKQTLWERITKTNHKDVTFYKGLLQEYTRELLMVLRLDFLEEITGHYIKNKTFEDD